MDIEGVMLSETNETERTTIDYIHMWNIKQETKKQAKQTNRYRQQVGGYQRRSGMEEGEMG